MRLVPLTPAGLPSPRNRWWVAGVSVLLHVLALAALLMWARRPELPQAAPSYDLVFEDPSSSQRGGKASGEAPATAPPAETAVPDVPSGGAPATAPPTPEPVPAEPAAPAASPQAAAPPPMPFDSLPGPESPLPVAPPSTEAPLAPPPTPAAEAPPPLPAPAPTPAPEPAPRPEVAAPPQPAPARVSEAPPSPPPESTVPPPPVPSPLAMLDVPPLPVEPGPDPAPAPPSPAPPAAAAEPPSAVTVVPAPRPVPQVRLAQPAPPAPVVPPIPAFVPPAPPLPLPPLPPPAPRVRTAPPPSATVGSLSNPMDLNFHGAAPRAPAARVGAAPGSVASRSVDLSTGPGKPGPNRQDAFFDARAAKLGADWMEGVRAYWLRHRYYPAQAAENGEDGTVDIELVVDRYGRVQSVNVKSRSGSSWLDMAAMGTFRNAQLPPVPAEVDAPYSFSLSIHYILMR